MKTLSRDSEILATTVPDKWVCRPGSTEVRTPVIGRYGDVSMEILATTHNACEARFIANFCPPRVGHYIVLAVAVEALLRNSIDDEISDAWSCVHTVDIDELKRILDRINSKD